MNKVTNIDNVRIGLIIQAKRRERALTLDSLGTAIECDHSTLSAWEHGRRPVPAHRVQTLADALNIDSRIINPAAA